MWSRNTPKEEGLYRCCRVYWYIAKEPYCEVFNVRLFQNTNRETKNYGSLVQEKTLRLAGDLDCLWWSEPIEETKPDVETLKGFYTESLNWDALKMV